MVRAEPNLEESKNKGKAVYGNGTNDLDYVAYVEKKNASGKNCAVYMCIFYKTWERVLRRSYQKAWLSRHPSYWDVEVSEDFKSARNFKGWMESQIYKECDELLHLDKDILFRGNKLYSAETCVFVPAFINKCLNTSERANRKTPVGVTKSGNRFISSMSTGPNSCENLGSYATQEQAHRAWQYARASRIEDRIASYSRMECFRQDVADALHLRVKRLREDADAGLITVSI